MRAKIHSKALKIVLACFAAAAVVVAGLGFAITPVTLAAKTEAADGVKPFSSAGTVGSLYYRIPSVLTTSDGTLVAAMDARFGGTADSPNNIDTAVSLSTDNGVTWNDSLAFSFQDWADKSELMMTDKVLRVQDSASLIDPSLVQDTQTGRIFMLVDAFPYATGFASSQVGSGYVQVDGELCMMLRKNGEKSYDYTVRDGVIYDKNGEKTAYSLNSRGEILENGSLLTVSQKRQHYWYTVPYATNTDVQVPMHVFYQDALFQAFPTSYLYLMWSDDNGRTWSDPVDLNAQVKADDVGFMGVCPGRGIQIENGPYAGRLVYPVYLADQASDAQYFSVIYSDDHGATWSSGTPVALNDSVSRMSETQLIQYPDGSLQAFSRTMSGYVGTAYSSDGGVTWQDVQLETDLPLTDGAGCQISAINYKGTIDGADAVLLSAPAGANRTNGFIYVGLVHEKDDRYTIDWTYKKEITDANTHFAYSCLTQLGDGQIGILYERSILAQTVDTNVFETYSIEELCADRLD